MKKTFIHITLLIICVVFFSGFSFSDYKVIYNDSNFLMEALFQLTATDLNNDQIGDFVVAGKNYTGREMFVYWLMAGPDGKPVIKWQSPNLYEDLSIIWVATGKFTTDKNQLLIMTNTRLFIYQYDTDNNTLALVRQVNHSFQPLKINSSVNCSDINGDGRPELVIARIGQVKSAYYDGVIQIWQLNEDRSGFTLVTESGLMKNIRGITTGDIDGDGKSEVFVEEGLQTQSGDIHMLRMDNSNRLQEACCLKNAVRGAVYAMWVQHLPDGSRLLTASNQGKVNFFSWSKSTLIPAEREMSFSCGLVALTASDLNNNQQPELIVGGYPQRLIILGR